MQEGIERGRAYEDRSAPVRMPFGRPILEIGPLGSREDTLRIYRLSTGIVIAQTGCFSGLLEQFEAQNEATHGRDHYGANYRSAIIFIRAVLAKMPVRPSAEDTLQELSADIARSALPSRQS